MKYFSQYKQDEHVDTILNKKENGFFVDIGAHNGKTGSNSFFFEKYRSWSGICIEPGPNEFKALTENRKSININCCVSNYEGTSNFTYINGYSNMLSGLTENYDPKHLLRISRELRAFGGEQKEIKVPVRTLGSILEEHKAYEIDYCSIDTEGSEYEIIKDFDFSKFKIKILSIENNYQDENIRNILSENGYNFHRLNCDDIFIKTP
jgi:FkbM family methyltransferase